VDRASGFGVGASQGCGPWGNGHPKYAGFSAVGERPVPRELTSACGCSTFVLPLAFGPVRLAAPRTGADKATNATARGRHAPIRRSDHGATATADQNQMRRFQTVAWRCGTWSGRPAPSSALPLAPCHPSDYSPGIGECLASSRRALSTRTAWIALSLTFHRARIRGTTRLTTWS
jgi:hypothetical protein